MNLARSPLSLCSDLNLAGAPPCHGQDSTQAVSDTWVDGTHPHSPGVKEASASELDHCISFNIAAKTQTQSWFLVCRSSQECEQKPLGIVGEA